MFSYGVIDLYAKSVQVRRHRLGKGVWSTTGRCAVPYKFRTVRNRPRVEHGLKAQRCLLSQAQRRNGKKVRGRLQQAQPLIGDEKERLILKDWSAQRATKVVLTLLTFGYEGIVSVAEPIVGVKDVI